MEQAQAGKTISKMGYVGWRRLVGPYCMSLWFLMTLWVLVSGAPETLAPPQTLQWSGHVFVVSSGNNWWGPLFYHVNRHEPSQPKIVLFSHGILAKALPRRWCWYGPDLRILDLFSSSYLMSLGGPVLVSWQHFLDCVALYQVWIKTLLQTNGWIHSGISGSMPGLNRDCLESDSQNQDWTATFCTVWLNAKI